MSEMSKFVRSNYDHGTKNQNDVAVGVKTRARQTDHKQRCTVYAIQLGLACSEDTARRTLRDDRGTRPYIIGNSSEFKVLQKWDRMTEFSRGFLYGVLKTRVEHMLEQGFGRRL